MNRTDDISKSIFNWDLDKKELLEKIFNSLNNVQLEKALKEAKIKDKEKIKNILIREFDFWIWSSVVVDADISGVNKIEAFYKAEIASRNKDDLNSMSANIEFKFEPKVIQTGSTISLISFAFLLLIPIGWFIFKNKK
jgi:hypothetical protein